MKHLKKTALIVTALAVMCTFVLAGCGGSGEEKAPEGDLQGETLQIYCGAGMTDPFQEIADTFMEKTGCEIDVTYANAGQIESQIKTSKQGDMFIAASHEELDRVKDNVTERTELVKHIPVLAVQKGNPKDITGLESLASDDVEFIMGDVESTPVGKIAKKSLKDAGILKKVNISATSTTAPQLTTALAEDEADATIVWKENCKGKDIEIVDTKDLDPYIKTIVAGSLDYTESEEALAEFVKFLGTEDAQNIWTSYGYELLD